MVQHIQASRVSTMFLIQTTRLLTLVCRKFFTFVVTLNGVGLFLAAMNIWTYPRRYTGAFVLGNLIFAILMRNELFGRLLYLLVNTCFAKVRIHPTPKSHWKALTEETLVVAAVVVPVRVYVCAPASRRYPLRMCNLRLCLAHLPCHPYLH